MKGIVRIASGFRQIGLVAVLAIACAGALQTEVLDRVIASVDGRPVLLSRVDEQARIVAMVDGRDVDRIAPSDRQAALTRVIDQLLIREHMVHGDFSIDEEDVTARLRQLRQELNAGSDQAWQAMLARYDLNEAMARQYVRDEAEQLQFVERRFRPSVQISDQQVETYYRTEFLPKLRERGASELPLAEVRPQIEQILAERQITSLMNSWIESLRTQGGIRVWVTFSESKGDKGP